MGDRVRKAGDIVGWLAGRSLGFRKERPGNSPHPLAPEAHFLRASLVIVLLIRHTVIRMEIALQEWRFGEREKDFRI